MRLFVCVFAGALAVAAQPPAPTYIPQTKFNTGQDVVPVYEGWLKNADKPSKLVAEHAYMETSFHDRKRR